MVRTNVPVQVGANDSANSWGTPVGAGTISLGVAFFLGSILETVGAVFLSGEVANFSVLEEENKSSFPTIPNNTHFRSSIKRRRQNM